MRSRKIPSLNMFRRIRICLLIAAYTLSYAGCSAEKSKAEELQSSYYSVVEYDLGEKMPDNSFLDEDRLVMCFTTYTEEFEEAYSEYTTNETLWETQAGPSDAEGNPIYPGNQLCVYDFEGNLLTDIDLGEELSPTLSSRSLVDNPSGGFCLLSTYTDFSSFEVTYQLAYFTEDGKLSKTLILLPGEYISNIQSMCISEDGTIYLSGWSSDYVDKVYIFGESGHISRILETGTVTLPDLLVIGDEIYLHASILQDGVYREALYALGSGTQNMPSPTLLPTEYPIECSVFTYGNACYTYDSQKMTEYSLDTSAVREIVTWSDTDMSISVIAAEILPQQKIICAGISIVTGHMTLSILSGTDTDPNADKEVLVIAGYGLEEDDYALALVYRFNNTHPDYKMTIRDYENEIGEDLTADEISQEIRRILLLDYVSDNAPDMYLDLNGNLSLAEYSDNDYLLDLDVYIDESEELTEDNYVTNILLASETEEGMYYLPACFQIDGFMGLAANIDGRKSWTIDEFDAMAAGLPEETVVQSELTKEDLLTWALQSSIDDYVDFDSLTADFTGENFLSLLAWADSYGAEQAGQITYSSMLDGNVALHFSYISSIDTLANDFKYLGDQVEYIGFPGEDSPGMLYYPRDLFAISSQSDAPDACWDLISDALSEQCQSSYIYDDIPVNRAAVQSAIDESCTLMAEADYYLFSAEDYDRLSMVYWDLIENTDEMYLRSDSISAIVMEEASAYFAGQKSADTVAALIQDRVQTLLNERL